MPEIVAAHLERVAKEIVEPLRERARQSLAYLDDLIAQARTGTEISLYESTRDKTLAQFDKLEQEICAALAACAREATVQGRNQGIAHCLQIVQNSRSTDEHVNWLLKKLADTMSEALERAAGEKGQPEGK